MKSVRGKLVSTKPISLSNAAKYISRFTSSDNGASHAVGVYLQRASDSFNKLVNFQKKLKGPHSRREGQVSHPLDVDAKLEALGSADKNPQGGKDEKSGRKGRGKKIEGYELKNDVPLESKQDKVMVGEVEARDSAENKQKDENNPIFGVNNEETAKTERSSQVVVKRKTKKSGKDKLKNEETVRRGVDGEDVDEQALDEGWEKRKQGEVDVNGAEGVNAQKKDKKKKKKRKENEDRDMEITGEEERRMKQSRGAVGEETDDLVDKSGKNSGNDKIKQHNVGGEGEVARVEEGSLEMRPKKKKRKNRDGEEGEKSLGVEEGKSKEENGEEKNDLAERIRKKKKRKTEGGGK